MMEYRSRVERLVAELQRQMVAGELSPGERLPSERNLCAAFGVGRTTVREALKALVVQGYVIQTRRGAVVVDPAEVLRPPSDLASLAAHATIRDLYEVRKLIEVRVAGWAALRATPADLERLRKSVEVEYVDTEGAGNPNTAFHDGLVAAARNPVMSQIYETSRGLFFRLPFYWELFEAGEVRSVRAWRHELARRWHRYILRAIEQRDVTEAEGAMFQHLDLMEKDLLGRLHRTDGASDGSGRGLHPLLAELRLSGDEPSKHRTPAPE